MLILKPDTLWEAVEGATRSALSAGALEPLCTTTGYVEDGGIRWIGSAWLTIRSSFSGQIMAITWERKTRSRNILCGNAPRIFH